MELERRKYQVIVSRGGAIVITPKRFGIFQLWRRIKNNGGGRLSIGTAFETIIEDLPEDRRGIFRNARNRSEDLPFQAMAEVEIDVSNRLILQGIAIEAERGGPGHYWYALAWVK